MKYRLVMSDRTKDERIELEIEAKNVFDAINYAAIVVDNPEAVELVEAIPWEGD